MGIDLALNTLPGGFGGLLKPIKGLVKAGKKADKIKEKLPPILNPAQEKNLKRFRDKIPANSKDNIKIHGLPNNGVAIQATSPGKVPGSSAVYEKQINDLGKTTQYTKTTYDNKGNIVYVKDKLER